MAYLQMKRFYQCQLPTDVKFDVLSCRLKTIFFSCATIKESTAKIHHCRRHPIAIRFRAGENHAVLSEANLKMLALKDHS